MFKKLIKNAVQHKAIAVLLVITLMGGGFFLYKKAKAVNGETFYVLEQVQKGTLIASVHGSGQTSSENQVDIKPKVSGDIGQAHYEATTTCSSSYYDSGGCPSGFEKDSNCSASYICVKSIGEFKNVKRAIEVSR